MDTCIFGLRDYQQRLTEQERDELRALTEQLPARLRTVFLACDAGKSYREITSLVGGVSQSRVRVLFGEAVRKLIDLHLSRSYPNDKTQVQIRNLRAVLSLRPYSALLGAGIQTVGELITYDPAELITLRNFGRRSLREIERLLASWGLCLASTKCCLTGTVSATWQQKNDDEACEQWINEQDNCLMLGSPDNVARAAWKAAKQHQRVKKSAMPRSYG